MFGKKWFLKHQKILVWFANTFIGKRILRYGLDRVDAILPSAVFKREGEKIIAEFRTHDKYSKRLYYAFKPLWHLLHAWDMAWYPNFNLGFDTITKYPVAGAVSPADGYARRDSIDETFATIRAGAGSTAGASDASAGVTLRASSTSSQYDFLVRHFFCFDTSAIGGGSINSATISLYGTGTKTNALGSPSLHIGGATMAGTDDVVTADFANRGTTSFGSIAYASWNDSAYNDVAFNASGKADINKTGISEFSAQLSWDILNDTTGLVWASGVGSSMTSFFADQAGTANDPRLVVTYAVSGFLAIL